MPEIDVQNPNITHSFLKKNTKLALKARKANKWSSQVPWDLFLDNVLP